MSCFIMNPESIRKIGYTLADILDSCYYSLECSIATNAAVISNELQKAFRIAYNMKTQHFDGEMISEILHRINAKAYAGRYNEPDETPFPEYLGQQNPRSLYRRSEYAEHIEKPQEWHYHLVALLDCWLYQTAEDASRECPERLAVKSFCNVLSREIIQHTPEYNLHRWGE